MSAPTTDCIFCKIATGIVPSKKVHEDDLVFAIRDIRPQAPTHLLVIPRAHVASLWELADGLPGDPHGERLAGRLLSVAAQLARAEGLEQGWRLIANTRSHGGQEVPHLHLHVVGGAPLGRMLPRAPGTG